MAKYRMRRPKPLPWNRPARRLAESRAVGCRLYRGRRRRTQFRARYGQLAGMIRWRSQVRRCMALGLKRLAYAVWVSEDQDLTYICYRGGWKMMSWNGVSEKSGAFEGED